MLHLYTHRHSSSIGMPQRRVVIIRCQTDMAPISRCQTGFMMWVWGCQLPASEGPKVWECHCTARRHTTSRQLHKHWWWARKAFAFVFVFLFVFIFVNILHCELHKHCWWARQAQGASQSIDLCFPQQRVRYCHLYDLVQEHTLFHINVNLQMRAPFIFQVDNRCVGPT